ncbi:ATP synthase subunit AtpR [Pikeienuella piscinae]|uniref:ATP synthase subunit AtpR n=1 Tax=Pikeienuella piscinae TaxID=2748098 RepID=A0A7L5BX90_9RHOB|nr:ATP synthase subunit I [Pikeienuella piscinae]QIE54209.1 ATP synthase subunit AtpR [Pikeienuella piscinae]
MMTPVLDFGLFGLGLLAGAMAAALFFAGLAWGMRLALRAARPVSVLLASAALRIALLLGVGWWVAAQGMAAGVGFALAFLAMRLALLATLRAGDEVT